MRIAIQEKLGLSKPWNSGFDRGGGFSVHCTWEFVVDGCRDGKGDSEADSPPPGASRRGGSAWRRGIVWFSVDVGLRLSPLT